MSRVPTDHYFNNNLSPLEKEVFELICELEPVDLFQDGLEELGGKIFIRSKENIEYALEKLERLKKKCKGKKDQLIRKYLDSVQTRLSLFEPGTGVGQITTTLSVYLIKEGINVERLKTLIDLLISSLVGWEEFLGANDYPVAVKVLTQYQVMGALEILDLVQKESKNSDPELSEKVQTLRNKVVAFKQKYRVAGFTNGEFTEIETIFSTQGSDLRRERFYPSALKRAFDYSETWKELEQKALRWIGQDLPKLKEVTKSLSKKLNCPNDPESVQKHLRSCQGMEGKEALETTVRIRPVIQALVAESIVGINPKYNARVVETPPYLTPLIPTAAAQGFDGLTSKPYQIYYLTTDPSRAPPGGLAELIDVLIHEEYGHCVHFSNTAAHYEADASLVELLPSLHSGTSSEGLAFQRELEFLDLLHKIARKGMKNKKSGSSRIYSTSEAEFVALVEEKYGAFDKFLLELEFAIYRFRIIRFLRVVGDTRINSGKQNLLEFLKWAEKKTGFAKRTVYYQIFPAHERIFPGYATCYAIVGQDIKKIQEKILKNDSEKLVKFNAYATSMGYPPRSIYLKRLEAYAKELAKKGK